MSPIFPRAVSPYTVASGPLFFKVPHARVMEAWLGPPSKSRLIPTPRNAPSFSPREPPFFIPTKERELGGAVPLTRALESWLTWRVVNDEFPLPIRNTSVQSFPPFNPGSLGTPQSDSTAFLRPRDCRQKVPRFVLRPEDPSPFRDLNFSYHTLEPSPFRRVISRSPFFSAMPPLDRSAS